MTFESLRPMGLPTIAAIAAIAAVGAVDLSCTGGRDPSAAASALAAPCATSAMAFVAHEDDDLLFLSPDILHAIQAGDTCVRTVYLTAGDAGNDESYWSGR